MAHHEAKVEVFNGISTEDVPSAGWGWSGLSKRAVVLSGLISVGFLVFMLVGNHEGNVENIWLIALAAFILVGTAWFAFEPKAKERTTVTARNKAQGHVEPNWTADQLNNTGVYADLTPEEKLALNIKE